MISERNKEKLQLTLSNRKTIQTTIKLIFNREISEFIREEIFRIEARDSCNINVLEYLSIEVLIELK